MTTPAINADPSMSLPCVIPQVTKALRGPLYSPFIRAWCPELGKHGITQDQFLQFLDGLNERWTTHPLFFFVSMSTMPVPNMFFLLLPAVGYTLQGVKWAIFPATIATSLIRTRMYVKKRNENIFHPAGLHISLMTSKKMLPKIKYPNDKLKLATFAQLENDLAESPLEDEPAKGDALEHEKTDNPWVRRMQALHGYASPLDFTVPAPNMPEAYFKKLAPRKANKRLIKKKIVLLKKLHRMNGRYDKRVAEVERNKTEVDLDIATLKENLYQVAIDSDEKAALVEEISRRSTTQDERVAKGMEKAEKIRDDYVRKEEKLANRIWWIVIRKWSDESEPEDEILGEDEDVEQEEQPNNKEV